tara:strand:- start:251 stop:799 length:549 start_codon:yes stop_codon:yes gene_type:complete
MSGWLYLIKNGDLYKIGITKNIQNRMRQLKPDAVVTKLYSNNFKQLERELHKRYKKVRIPQTEYFRLNHFQIREIKQRISDFYYPKGISFVILKNSFSLIALIFLLILILNYFIIKDINNIFLMSLLWMEMVSFFLSVISLFIKSNKYLSFLHELKFRLTRLCFYIIFAFIFKFSSGYFMNQ